MRHDHPAAPGKSTLPADDNRIFVGPGATRSYLMHSQEVKIHRRDAEALRKDHKVE